MPLAVLFAGPNGSGKSTITHGYRREPWFPARYLNADEIASTIHEGSQQEREQSAFRQARALRQRYREDGESFAFETVFSHPSTLLDMQRLRADGFTIHLIFVATESAEINVGRVARRVLSGGHDVPIDKIRSRYARSLSLLPRVMEEADRVDLFDNSDRDPVLCYQQSEFGARLRDPLPQYLRTVFDHLTERAAERQAIDEAFPAVVTPEEEAGVYEGRIVHSSLHFIVQETEAGLIRHDRLLLTSAPVSGTSVSSVDIRYRDAAGIVSDL